MIPYRAMLDVPAELLRYLTRLLAAERRRRGTPARSRKLTCRDQALLALRWFRDRTRRGRLAVDHGISRATAYRYVAEAVDVLSAQAPGLDRPWSGHWPTAPYVILDGKIFETDRLAETVTSAKGDDINAWYSGKKHRPGANVQAVMLPGGLPVWTARPSPATSTTSPPPGARPARPLPRRRPRNADARRRRLRGSRNRHLRPRQEPARKPAASTPTRKPATACSAACAARENEGSPCSPSAGPPSSASPPAQGEPPR